MVKKGVLGWLHTIRTDVREKFILWKEENPGGCLEWIQSRVCGKTSQNDDAQVGVEGYSHIFRRKTRQELVRISAAVTGIEFSYAAETAFVSPTLLKIGVEHQHMTLVWALSPLVGFFLTPILGSLSDKCPSKYGRRRPFIFFMSLGVLLGLLLVPNGESLGYLAGDPPLPPVQHRSTTKERTVGVRLWSRDRLYNQTLLDTDLISYNNSHPWGILFTVLGTVLLDFDADACQSPARAYLLDVTTAEDHARGLSTFTVMAGLGGFMGYALGGINWDVTFIGDIFGGHVRAVFSLITIIFISCVGYTITSFKEMPLRLLEAGADNLNLNVVVGVTNKSFDSEDETLDKTDDLKKFYGSVDKEPIPHTAGAETRKRKSVAPDPNASLKIYLKSIVYMPHSMRMLCLTNLFCWSAHVCYSLYFTDFVGEAVFGGDPTAPEGSTLRELYESGVRFGCWGMSMYSLSCACYSSLIETFISKFGAKKVYVGGLLTYSAGMLMMALTKNKAGVIIFSGTAGVMYSTLFTMPYLIVANYHAKGVFGVNRQGEEQISSQIRGLGTDVAIVSSMVFLAQFILSVGMGSIVSLSGTTTAVVSVAATLAFFGAVSATRVVYLDL